MQRFFLQGLTCGLAACFVSNSAVFAAETTPQGSSSTVFSSNLELALLYVDEFARPGAGAIQPRSNNYAMQAPGNRNGERALGLRYAKATFDLESAYSSKLTAVLRPDALAREPGDTVRYETDTRAGDVYRAPSEVRLLDAYQIVVRPGTGMSLGFGVWAEASKPALAYQQILQPGLDVILPSKFSGMRLRWNRFQPLDPANYATRQRGIVADLFVIQGDGDRVESNVRNQNTDDDAPGAKDPHFGAAACVQWNPSDLWTLLVSGGSLSADVPNQVTGNVNNVFGDINAIIRMPSLLRGMTGSLQYKHSQETFRATSVAMDDRTQKSLLLQFSAGVVPGTSVLAGFSHGTGEWPIDASKPGENSEFSGYQVEVGVINTVGKDLYVQAMLAQERRTRKDLGASEVGAFSDGTESKNIIRRFGVQLSYNMSGSR